MYSSVSDMYGIQLKEPAHLSDRVEVSNELTVSFLAEAHHPCGTTHGQDGSIPAEGHACDGVGGGQVVGLDQGMAEQVPGLYAAPLTGHHEVWLGGVGQHGGCTADHSLHVHNYF